MNQRGFSLLELKICCAVFSILVAVGYPFLGGVKQSMALREEISALYTSLQRAKIEAIKENSFVVFQIIPNGYSIFVDDGARGGKKGDWIRQNGEHQLTHHCYQDGISLAKTTFTANRTRFNGRVALKAGRVILTNRDGFKTELVVNTVGRFRVEKL